VRIKILNSGGYVSEEKLVRAIVACVRRARGHGFRVEAEVDAGVGIADIVLSKRAPRSSYGLFALGNVSPRLAVLLSQDISGAIKNRKALATCLGSSEATAQRVIAQLTAAGVARHTQGTLDISEVARMPFERLVAVEAKISDWQRVLVQAHRNLQFADESWAVLDYAYARSAIAQVHRFAAAGVGLASMDREQGLLIHYSAGTRGPVSDGKRWQAQAVLAARVLKRRKASSVL
jgi:hypothetical protein